MLTLRHPTRSCICCGFGAIREDDRRTLGRHSGIKKRVTSNISENYVPRNHSTRMKNGAREKAGLAGGRVQEMLTTAKRLAVERKENLMKQCEYHTARSEDALSSENVSLENVDQSYKKRQRSKPSFSRCEKQRIAN